MATASKTSSTSGKIRLQWPDSAHRGQPVLHFYSKICQMEIIGQKCQELDQNQSRLGLFLGWCSWIYFIFDIFCFLYLNIQLWPLLVWSVFAQKMDDKTRTVPAGVIILKSVLLLVCLSASYLHQIADLETCSWNPHYKVILYFSLIFPATEGLNVNERTANWEDIRCPSSKSLSPCLHSILMGGAHKEGGTHLLKGI